MSKGRLEAFSDGVLAIIITIMVLELKVPQGQDPAALAPLAPSLTSYVMSFFFLGIYWNNHHHLLQAVRHVNGLVLWANMLLLFFLSLVPLMTGWMGATHFAPWPVAIYGAVLLLSGVSYYLLSRALIASQGPDSVLAGAVGRDRKGLVSLAFYAGAIPLAFLAPWASCLIYVLVAAIWLVPDRRIERAIDSERKSGRL